MNQDKYIITCPRCGRVEGSAPALEEEDRDRDEAPEVSDIEIEEEDFEIAGRPVRRVRCPQCGSWVSPDLVQPED